MELEIINHIPFPTFTQIKEVAGFFYELKAIKVSIYNYDDENFIATCSWCYESLKTRKEFPYTLIGYRKAIDWIEYQRLELIKELL